MIQNRVKQEIFPMLSAGKMDEAELGLRKLMLSLTEKKCTEDHRIVLCNLARIRYLSNDIDNSKHYMSKFEERLTKDKNYKNEFQDRYCDYLNLKAEIYKDEITKEEQMKIHEINYENAIRNNDIARMLMARSNIALLNCDCEEIEDLLMEIHNYEASKIGLDNEGLMTMEKLNDIKFVKNEIIKDVQAKYPEYFKEKSNCAY